MLKQTTEELQRLQALTLPEKILKTKQRIYDWYMYFNGQVYVSFSGGKDSTVLLHIARQMFPDIPAVYAQTPDFPDVRQFVDKQDNVVKISPALTYHQIIEKYGYPIISKEIAEAIYYARRNAPRERERERERADQQTVGVNGKTTIRKQKELLGLRTEGSEYG